MTEPLKPSWAWLGVSLGLVLGLLVAVWLWVFAEGRSALHEPVQLAARSVVAVAPPNPAASSVQPTAPTVLASVALAPTETPAPADDLAAHIPTGQEPSMREVIEGLHARGIRTGLGAFNPPGTKPVLVGLAVPEDFALPPGYVRHHQATDDGQRVEAILMFAPDFRLFDAQGREIALPANRVVPPELAPAGLPLRRIQVPAPATEPRP